MLGRGQRKLRESIAKLVDLELLRPQRRGGSRTWLYLPVELISAGAWKHCQAQYSKVLSYVARSCEAPTGTTGEAPTGTTGEAPTGTTNNNNLPRRPYEQEGHGRRSRPVQRDLGGQQKKKDRSRKPTAQVRGPLNETATRAEANRQARALRTSQKKGASAKPREAAEASEPVQTVRGLSLSLAL